MKRLRGDNLLWAGHRHRQDDRRCVLTLEAFTMYASPTPYADVNAVVQVLLSSVQTIFWDHFVGMYLHGSFAGGDFDGDSDVDFVVVTDDEISGDLFSALEAMHMNIATIDSWCATQLDGSYIPKQALRRFDPAHALHPHIDRGRGERLGMMVHDSNWVIQRLVLREQGVVVEGPAPHALIDPISPDNLRQAVLALLQVWAMPILADPAQINKRGYQSFCVLSMCRILYTLHFGTVATKPMAARWAKETLGEPWVPLIDRAWIGDKIQD